MGHFFQTPGMPAQKKVTKKASPGVRPADGAKDQKPKQNQKPDQEPLTLALFRRESELIEVFGGGTPICDTVLNSDSERLTNRLPLLRERAGVRGKSTTNLGTCKKVGRRKGETLSSRYRSNGYTPNPPSPITAHKKCPDLSTGAFSTTLQNHQPINAKPPHSPPTRSANAQTAGRTAPARYPPPPTCQ